LVLATVSISSSADAVRRLAELLPVDKHELGRAALHAGYLGTITPVVKGANRSFEVVARRDG
jgi:hypothetical protein